MVCLNDGSSWLFRVIDLDNQTASGTLKSKLVEE